MLLLSADIGGTWARLLAVQWPGGQRMACHSYASKDFSSLAAVINTFQEQYNLPDFSVACLGLPGPITGRCVSLTNLPWKVDADALGIECNIGRIELINDFQAAAYGVDTLRPEQLLVLHKGQAKPQGHRLVAGAGTGLGVAPMLFCNGRYTPVACEGGHMDFSPLNDVQQGLLRWLWQQWSRVSNERILSGSGLELLYGYFAGLQHPQQAGAVSAAQVTALANDGDAVASQALTTFVTIYGSCLGNMALLWPAHAGVYIVGGVAAKIIPWMQQPVFLQAMHDKGRMRDLVHSMPVYLVTEAELGLKGAMLKAQEIVS